MIVFGAVDDDALPRVLFDLDPRGVHRVDVVDEVSREGQPVVLDEGDTLFLGVGEDGLLLGVGGQHGGLIALEVRSVEIASQAGRHVEVANLVACRVAHDANHTILGLAVAVRAQDDLAGQFGHVQLPR